MRATPVATTQASMAGRMMLRCSVTSERMRMEDNGPCTTAATGATDFVVNNDDGTYAGMVVADDIKTALLEREAIPLLLAGDLVRSDLPMVKNTDDLAGVLEIFSRYEVARLPVCLSARPTHVIGLISRRALIDQYHKALQN